MNTYKIEVKLCIKEVKDYNGKTFAESEVVKSVTVPAANVREEATKIVRQAVANFSESAITGLANIIAEEPKIEGQPPQATLEV